MLLVLHTHTLKTFYSEFIRSWFPTRTTSVLHATVQDSFNVETVKLIFELVADPNAIYQNGRTPLHLLAGIDDINWELNVSMFKTLVDAGTHLDMAADDSETVLDVLKRNVAPPKASKSTRFYIRYPVPCSLCLVTVHELSVSREFGTTNLFRSIGRTKSAVIHITSVVGRIVSGHTQKDECCSLVWFNGKEALYKKGSSKAASKLAAQK
jgi:hypothetical protein